MKITLEVEVDADQSVGRTAVIRRRFETDTTFLDTSRRDCNGHEDCVLTLMDDILTAVEAFGTRLESAVRDSDPAAFDMFKAPP